MYLIYNYKNMYDFKELYTNVTLNAEILWLNVLSINI